MRLSHLFRAVACAATLAAPAVPWAQRAERPRDGKINEVERDAKRAEREGCRDDNGCGGDAGFAIELAGDIFRALFAAPEGYGRGYLAYPYASRRRETAFVLDDVERGRRFLTLSATRFADADPGYGTAGRLRGVTFAIEGANSAFHYALEHSRYTEGVGRTRDELLTGRLGLGGAPRLGDAGYARIGVGARFVALDTGDGAVGPDVELGFQVFPARPLGAGAIARVGALSWAPGSWRAIIEVSPSASVFIGPLEVRAGWHWLKLGRATAFSGATVGTRIWF